MKILAEVLYSLKKGHGTLTAILERIPANYLKQHLHYRKGKQRTEKFQ